MNDSILKELSNFTGTENWYKHWSRKLVYTDGVKYLADNAGAHWLIDAIASWQIYQKVSKHEFQCWFLEFNQENNHWELFATDGNDEKISSQIIEFSDFPAKRIKLYLANGVLLLPSEY